VVIFITLPSAFTTTLTNLGIDFPSGVVAVPRKVTRYNGVEFSWVAEGLFADGGF
jgi:hypothetical protein